MTELQCVDKVVYLKTQRKSGRMAGYKTNMQKYTAFLQSNNKQYKTEIPPRMILIKILKHLRINLNNVLNS